MTQEGPLTLGLQGQREGSQGVSRAQALAPPRGHEDRGGGRHLSSGNRSHETQRPWSGLYPKQSGKGKRCSGLFLPVALQPPVRFCHCPPPTVTRGHGSLASVCISGTQSWAGNAGKLIWEQAGLELTTGFLCRWFLLIHDYLFVYLFTGFVISQGIRDRIINYYFSPISMWHYRDLP